MRPICAAGSTAWRGWCSRCSRSTRTLARSCLAHLRRKIFDVHDSQPTELSTTAMAGIQAIYWIEEEIRGLPPAERLAARRRPDHWSARCDDSSCARARVCRAMPISRRPSPMAPGDGARSIASSMMASSSPTPHRGARHSRIYGRQAQLAFLGQLRRGRAVSGRAQHR